jgi:hypothetical protein
LPVSSRLRIAATRVTVSFRGIRGALGCRFVLPGGGVTGCSGGKGVRRPVTRVVGESATRRGTPGSLPVGRLSLLPAGR